MLSHAIAFAVGSLAMFFVGRVRLRSERLAAFGAIATAALLARRSEEV